MSANKKENVDAAPSPPKRRRKRSSKVVYEDEESDSKKKKVSYFAVPVQPGEFVEADHFYPRVLNATVHTMVAAFMRMKNENIARRYCHLHPKVQYTDLIALLKTTPTHFRWAGSDLFLVATPEGKRQMVVIETNSCPSGQKSMPSLSDDENNTGYHRLMAQFHKMLKEEKKADLPEGDLAVVYDKNPMEAIGYASALADVSGENVWRAEFYKDDPNPPVRFTKDMTMELRDEDGKWHPIRACFRYVTQKPWNRLPIVSKTEILNKIVSCLAGGRNKLTACKAYMAFNTKMQEKHLVIRFPETIRDVQKAAIPMWVQAMGGMAVVKNPYSNAGQGVYTITSQKELDTFMREDEDYDKFIVQNLVGNSKWSSATKKGTFYHCGTVPNSKGQAFIFDLRMMCSAGPNGFQPAAVYARQAAKPLVDNPEDIEDSWAMLGTNLSIKKSDGKWDSDTRRLRLMDRKDFNQLGLGMDDLIDGYVQTVLSVLAIDDMAVHLLPEGSKTFNSELFKCINEDDSFLREIKYG